MPDEHPTGHDLVRAPPDVVVVSLLVGAGAFVGANLRFGVAAVLPALAGTLAANVLGCLLLGALLARPALGGRHSREVRLALGTGVLSSFTTYSAFALETASVAPGTAIGYVLATYALGLAAVVVGRRSAGRPDGGDA